jgi:simple sugar transport system substrate-binding protein
MNPTVKVAKRFADVKFEHATGYKRAPNVSTYMARFYEGRYVAGTLAGRMTKSGTIGYIGSFPIPEVVRGINSFTLALRKVRPDWCAGSIPSRSPCAKSAPMPRSRWSG